MDIDTALPDRLRLPLRYACCVLVAGCLVAGMLAEPSPAQTSTACRDVGEETPEEYGPTDISAVTGNQRMSVALNPDATVTVLKWPSPSYYDQIKYRTTDRSQPRMGALPNEGALLGIGFKKGAARWRFQWLREWSSRQRFDDDDNDEVVTVFRKRFHGLRVVVRDVVAHDRDALTRHVRVTRSRKSAVTRARLISFANFNPVYSKSDGEPSEDWCTESDNDEGGYYDGPNDAIVHARFGIDESTGQPSAAALSMGFDARSDGVTVGADTYQSGTGGASAYDDASDARLSGTESAPGQADAAIADDIALRSRRSGASTLHITAAPTASAAISTLNQMRARSPGSIRRSKRSWWNAWLRPTKLPKNAPRPIVRLAKRGLIALRQATDSGGLIVASVSTQPPLGLDWIRHGAYINHMLQVAGHPEMARKHNLRYAQLQAGVGEVIPAGNWAENYYADGQPGGPRSYEIDQTGLGMWTLWDHFQATGDRIYLFDRGQQRRSVYEAIQRAAHYVSDDPPLGCRDPATGLNCPAFEERSSQPQRSLVGAQAVWLGLGGAVRAARELGTDTATANAAKWQARREELLRAIKQNYLNERCNCFTSDYRTGGTTLWPVRLARYRSKAADGQAAVNWRQISPAMAGGAARGGQESRALLGNAYAWKRRPWKMRNIKNALLWVATATTTGETGLLGNDWMRYPRPSSRIVTMSGQPHVWNHAMFYLAALKAYGRTTWSP